MSDFDPEGEMIPQVAGRTLRDGFGVPEDKLVIVKAGVAREQVQKYNLPPMAFAKESSSNHDWFVERNGGDGTVWELEALDPEAMIQDLEKAVQKVLDLNLFNGEVAREQEEAAVLEATQRRVREALRGVGEE